MERKRQTGNKGAQQSATNIFIQLLEEKVVRKREKLAETNTLDRGTSERVTGTSQGGNKKHIDWPCQSEAVNERGRRRRRRARLLPSRQQGRKRREEVSFNQTLSRSVCSEWASPPGRSFTERTLAAGGLSSACWEGPVPSKDRHRDKSITIIIHITAIIMQIPHGEGDAAGVRVHRGFSPLPDVEFTV